LSALASSLQLEEETEEHVPKKNQKQKKAINMFDLLNDDGGDSASESPIERENSSGRSDSEVVPPVRPTGTKAKKKLKKKSKKPQADHETVDFEDEFFAENSAASEASNESRRPEAPTKSVLNVEQKSLNPDNELKKIFGSKIIQSGQKKKARGRAYVKSAWLMNPKENWAQIRKTGLSMSLDHTKDGYFYFKFEHNKEYRQVQMNFWEAVASLNPQNIVAIVNAFPYHIDAIIQLSEIGRINDDVQMATELIERALYIMESAFHPSFNLASGNCRLQYKQQENRALFLTIFKHLVCIGQRGCYRTALELCKVLYTLDMEADPLAVVLMMDFYAIRAGEFSWFIDFFNCYEPSKNLSQLPNMAYAIALAHFYHSRAEASSGALQRADEHLQRALLMFPSVLIPMLEKCSIQPDHRVKTHSYFSPISSPNHPCALDNLVGLYIGRSFHTWKDPDLLPWLERNAHSCMAQIDADASVTSSYQEKRKVRYQGTPRNIYRHIILSDIKDVTAALPQELADSVTSFDPLPPVDSVSSYDRPARNSGGNAAASANDGGILSTFFRSMMPDFNPQQAMDQANQPPHQQHIERLAVAAAAVAGTADAAEEDQQSEAGANLQRNVATLVNAMRDLLGSINLPDLGRHGEQQEGVEEEPDIESE